jgi:short-subunit dehydrogenase
MADQGKVVLVTGASSGFGESIASFLASKGYTVFGTSRNPKKHQKRSYQMLKLDVTSDSSVKACVAEIIRRAGRIDVLVNNAGYISSGGVEESTIEEAKAQFETNFFGAVRMINAVLPHMRRRKEGQIINISSMADTISTPFRGFYSPTKAALTSYSDTLRLEVKNFNIKVSVIRPGMFSTKLFSSIKRTSRSIPDYARTKRRSIIAHNKRIRAADNPVKVAKLVLKIIRSNSPRLLYAVGKDKHYLLLKSALPQELFESGLRKHFQLDE